MKCLAAQDAEQGVTDIAKSTGISPSSCFNILKTLSDLDLAAFNEKTKGYSIGLGVFELARTGLSHDPILVAAQPVLTTLAQRHTATLGLWEIVNDSEAVLIAMGQNSSPARVQLQIGSRQPIASGASGRAALSTYQKDTPWLAAKFAEVMWQGSINFEDYLRDVEQAEHAGYAIDRDKYHLGISTVSAAIFEKNTNKRYCLTAVLLSGAYDNDAINAIGNDLKSEVDKLSGILRTL